jgi:hypothetical protein
MVVDAHDSGFMLWFVVRMRSFLSEGTVFINVPRWSRTAGE